MHSLPTTSPAVFNTHISQHCGPGKYASNSPPFASVVSSSADSSSAIPVAPQPQNSLLFFFSLLCHHISTLSFCQLIFSRIYSRILFGIVHRSDSTHLQPSQAQGHSQDDLSASGSHLSAGDQQQHLVIGSDSASASPASNTAGANLKVGLNVSDGENLNNTNYHICQH